MGLMASGETILVVEDDLDMRETICSTLIKDGYQVEEAGDAKEMRSVLGGGRIDLVILDLVLPGESGFNLAREVRSNSDIPLIILSGKGDVIDKVVGLEIGADDYITKPFFPRELIARVGTVLRRMGRREHEAVPATGTERPSTIQFGDWTLDLFGQRLTKSNGDPVTLTTYEFQVLSAMAQRPGMVLSRDQIMDLVAGREWNPLDRSIDVLIAKLRKKIGDNSRNPQFIRTVRNTGYMFVAKTPSADSQDPDC